MEATGLSLGKSVLNGALGYAKSAVAEEVALQLGVQRDQAFIRDELEMMLSFLMAVHEERDEHKVVKTWVKQVRDMSYDVEDCLQDLVVRLGKPSWWCFLRTLLDRHRVAKRMKELRAKVEDVSQRNVRYRLIKGTGPKPATGAGPSSISGATMFSIEEARRHKDRAKVDLSQLIKEGNEDLRVIAVWGTSGLLGQTVAIERAYNDLKRSNKFELHSWVRIVHPFNPLEFLQCIMRQFYRASFQKAGNEQEKTTLGTQVLKEMGNMKEDDFSVQFNEHVNEKSYLIVLNDISTFEEWDWIQEYFPNNKKGSRTIVSTEHGEVARMCMGQESVMSELKQSVSDQSIFACYNKVYQNGTELEKPGSSLNEAKILSANNSLVPRDEILESQHVGATEKMVRKSLTRIGTVAGALEESLLVGREKEKYDIINLISNRDAQQLTVISVWGMGGLGKTTLVKEVYQSQDLSGLFEKRACITVMHPFILEELVNSLVMQLDAGSSNRTGNIEELGKLLEGKRCLLVLDDLSSIVEWDLVMPTLSKMGNTSRIIVTTREENIAKHCSQKPENIYKLMVLEYKDAFDLFTKKVFKEDTNLDNYPGLIEEAKPVLKKCNGLPLAIVTIGGFLAKQPKTPLVWRKLNEHLSAELEMNPELGIIKTILMKSYDGLPYHLKSCFLYMSIFPEDYNITRRRLVHRWNAEGYSSDARGKSLREIADTYFMELIDRSMILPVKELNCSRKGISSCKLHDLMREISISKAMEENLVFRLEEGCNLSSQGTIRHLAVSSNWEGDQNEYESITDWSHVRSLTVFGKWKPFYISDKMKLLRVLDLESTKGLVNHHLEPIGKLLHLKYLSLRGCRDIFHLPDSVGNLEQLQTLDITYTLIDKLPQAIIKLVKLQYFRAGRCYGVKYSCFGMDFISSTEGVAVPRGLRRLKSLHTLCTVNIARGKAILQDIKRLTRLRKLAVIGINKKNCQEFCSTLAHLSHLESLSVRSDKKGDLRGCLDALQSPTKNLQSLKLLRTLGKLPEWVAGLQNLVKLKLEYTWLTEIDGTIQVLGRLPNLAILRLWEGSFEGVEPCFLSSHRETSFPNLTVLHLKNSGIRLVVFGEGTAPKLELLVCDGDTSLSGLSSLPSLKEVLIGQNYGFSGKELLVEDVRAQLTRNPNKPVLKSH